MVAYRQQRGPLEALQHTCACHALARDLGRQSSSWCLNPSSASTSWYSLGSLSLSGSQVSPRITWIWAASPVLYSHPCPAEKRWASVLKPPRTEREHLHYSSCMRPLRDTDDGAEHCSRQTEQGTFTGVCPQPDSVAQGQAQAL